MGVTSCSATISPLGRHPYGILPVCNPLANRCRLENVSQLPGPHAPAGSRPRPRRAGYGSALATGGVVLSDRDGGVAVIPGSGRGLQRSIVRDGGEMSSMLRILGMALGLAIVLTIATAEAGAQPYYPGYGPYGWSGWGGWGP